MQYFNEYRTEIVDLPYYNYDNMDELIDISHELYIVNPDTHRFVKQYTKTGKRVMKKCNAYGIASEVLRRDTKLPDSIMNIILSFLDKPPRFAYIRMFTFYNKSISIERCRFAELVNLGKEVFTVTYMIGRGLTRDRSKYKKVNEYTFKDDGGYGFFITK